MSTALGRPGQIKNTSDWEAQRGEVGGTHGLYASGNSVTVTITVTVTVTATVTPPPPRQNKSCYAQFVFRWNVLQKMMYVPLFGARHLWQLAYIDMLYHTYIGVGCWGTACCSKKSCQSRTMLKSQVSTYLRQFPCSYTTPSLRYFKILGSSKCARKPQETCIGGIADLAFTQHPQHTEDDQHLNDIEMGHKAVSLMVLAAIVIVASVTLAPRHPALCRPMKHAADIHGAPQMTEDFRPPAPNNAAPNVPKRSPRAPRRTKRRRLRRIGKRRHCCRRLHRTAHVGRLRRGWNQGPQLRCEFMKEEMEYLGFDVGYGWWKPAASKMQALQGVQIRDDPEKGLYDVRSFVGACNFYRRHIHNFTYSSAPLTGATAPGPWHPTRAGTDRGVAIWFSPP